MKLTKKLNATMILVLICLIMLLVVSYAWLTIALRPEVQRLETNVGANGSLEIALLNEMTYEDTTRIMTKVGDSAVKQEVTETNVSWGNVIQLSEDYGLEEIVLLPARLNVKNSEDDTLRVASGLLKTAEFGVDGRIRLLRDDTVSTTWEENWDKGNFTYYVDGRRYGVRAIGNISNLTKQQTALADSRTLVSTYTGVAVQKLQNTWQEHGAGIVDIIYRYYALKQNNFTKKDAQFIQGYAEGILESTEYVLDAMYQTAIGFAAANIVDEPEFEYFYDQINNPANYGKVSGLLGSMEVEGEDYEKMISFLVEAEKMFADAQSAVTASYTLSVKCQWETIESILSLLMSPDHVYMGNKLLSDSTAFEQLASNNVLMLSPDAGVMSKISDFAGNYIAYTVWKDNINLELLSASKEQKGVLLEMHTLLKSMQASAGGWTRANLDDTCGFAIDMAFRCNTASDLLLQTWAEMRVKDDSEFPVTQGSGSFMQFHSDNMEYDQLINLMNTIRVGFINEKGELLGVAKLDLSKSKEEEAEVFAPLYLWEYALEEEGSLAMVKRSDSAVIRDLPQNSPMIITVVVWMDGDSVDNSMVGQLAQQSMSGTMNLQFSSSADLVPSKQLIDRN